MKRITPRFSKLALSIFVALFALSIISISVSNGFLQPSIAEAAEPAFGPAMDNPGIKKAMEVQGRHSQGLMGIPGVVGHGIGVSSDGKPVIKIFVKRAGIPGIPAALEGIPTKVEVTGMIVAYADPTARFDRPVPIGVSTGHPDITAGTIGCRVTDGTNVYALSNNHVYANQNDANEGDSALQPGPYDGGVSPEDDIGTLYDFEPIDFSGGNNTIDAAIALSSESELGTSTPDDGYGIPGSTPIDAKLRLKVQKYGRTTGWTHGKVAETNVTVDVCYEAIGSFLCVKSATFVNQIGIFPGTFSAGGDSGSLIVTDDNHKYPVGLLFAGGSTRTFANPIGSVLERFGVAVDDGSSSGNITPTADFSFTTSDRTATFTDKSTDSDGNIAFWDWDFADGNTSTEQNPSHTYAARGTYTVTLTVTDNDGATDIISKDVAVSSDSPTNITLTATEKQNKVWLIVNLAWSGATSPNVDIHQGGGIIATTANDGAYTDKISNSGGGTYTYQVCEEGSSADADCSDYVSVTF